MASTPPPSNPSPDDEPRNVVMQGHHYDGIREYDNPMPGWWVWLFWLTIAFAPMYVLGINVFGFIDSYQDDLAEGQAELETRRETFLAANPTTSFDEQTLAAYAEDPAHVTAGQPIYQTNCLPCHGAAGEGGIGPNLADAYWIHGNTFTDMFDVVTHGVLEKGMTPWESILSPEERAQVVAFVHSLYGTNPPNAKEPQGELYEAFGS